VTASLSEVAAGPAATVGELLQTGARQLGKSGIVTPRSEATALLSDALDRDNAALLAHPEWPVSPREARRYVALVERRSRFEPLAYIIGEREFFGRRFFVNKHALIPRPETEMLVEAAFEELTACPPGQLVVDVGTGTGCIAASLAAEAASARVVAIDLSRDALELAGLNLRRLRLSERVRLIRGDVLTWLRPDRDDQAVIVANMPYIPTEAYDELPPDVKHYEPRLALDGGPRGTSLIVRLLQQAREHSLSVLLAELDPRHADEVLDTARGYFPNRAVDVLCDLAGRQRLLRVGRTR
jgi:release factor glutamine methyltransferase